MKKFTIVVSLLIISLTFVPSVFAVNVGTYKTETEYGLLDGFKINWKRKDKSQPFIQPRAESSAKEAEKDYQRYNEIEYERTKYMYEGKAIF